MVFRRHRAIPFVETMFHHRQGDDRIDQVGIAGAVEGQLIALHERRIIAAGVELHRFGDRIAVERHDARRGDRQLGLAQRGIFRGPDHAAVGQLHRELALGHGLAGLLDSHGDAAVGLQRFGRGVFTRIHHRLALAARAQAEQQSFLRTAASVGAIHPARSHVCLRVFPPAPFGLLVGTVVRRCVLRMGSAQRRSSSQCSE